MRLFNLNHDGGKDSGVCGWFIVELKKLFSIAVLHFNAGSREAFHSHAFNAVTLWLKGTAEEINLDGTSKIWKAGQIKFTPRRCFHKVVAGPNGVWALTFRGPWVDLWHEYKNGKLITLTHGRKVVAEG